ncbi:class I SAM-dependent methyltransferase [Ascoidea rubescens DSM 1968]|uniref:S-adenosyl-L-methionine-dependent methyltransferase n=1 Tax=Ascoidea rubescens DSM 1968 TaxID=1344418 RepID=A0A1D2VLV0_9ASCO|nr:S-adenosyl-L-methionine-dependent methyltransferase [Ascoidea rubescens DSM 1968]ODV62588.1 S-adenosyl-L-methionine-dependent methyltransferase [Ascoidea rubescens DSM 1968]
MSTPKEIVQNYIHGDYIDAIKKAYTWRNAKNSAPHLLPHLKPGLKILDVGCGPGSITADFVRAVGPTGKVVCVEINESILNEAKSNLIKWGVYEGNSIEFVVDNILFLDKFDDNEFDIVHVHQVIQHLKDPVKGLEAMKRVCKKNGIVSIRESIYEAFYCMPENYQAIKLWKELYLKININSGFNPNAGKFLKKWCREAGFDVNNTKKFNYNLGNWFFTQREDIKWWGLTWADRVVNSGFAKKLLEDKQLGVTENDLQYLSDGWKKWTDEEDALFIVDHGEVIYFK